MMDARHRAVQREAQLAASQIAHGVTVLGRANHAQSGFYAQAFFALSIGFERMGKLVLLADHAIRNNGLFPTNKELRSIGHDLLKILSECERISDSLDSGRQYAVRPQDAIHQAIEQTISQFAVKLRYYNLNHLSGAASDQEDPIGLWWNKVALPICERHYSKQQRMKDEADAVLMECLMSNSSVVIHTAEEGTPINTAHAFFARAGATRVVQKYGRMYTLQIARWLSSIIYELSHTGAYDKRIEPLLGLHEPFAVFCNEDSYFRNRKTWRSYA